MGVERRFCWSHRLRGALVAGVAVAALLVPVSGALAGGLTVTVSADPTEGVPMTFRIQGTAPAEQPDGGSSYLELRVNPVSQPCADTPFANDTATREANGPRLPSATTIVSGPFDVSETATPDPTDDIPVLAGSFHACAWLGGVDPSEPPMASGELTYTVREPHFSVQLSRPPRATFRLDRRTGVYRGTTVVTARVSGELGNRVLYVGMMGPGSRRCPRTPVRYSFGGGPEVALKQGAATYRARVRMVSKRLPYNRRVTVCALVLAPDGSTEDVDALTQTSWLIRRPAARRPVHRAKRHQHRRGAARHRRRHRG